MCNWAFRRYLSPAPPRLIIAPRLCHSQKPLARKNAPEAQKRRITPFKHKTAIYTAPREQWPPVSLIRAYTASSNYHQKTRRKKRDTKNEIKKDGTVTPTPHRQRQFVSSFYNSLPDGCRWENAFLFPRSENSKNARKDAEEHKSNHDTCHNSHSQLILHHSYLSIFFYYLRNIPKLG